MKLAIIIPFYKGGAYLKACLLSIEEAIDQCGNNLVAKTYIVENSPNNQRIEEKTVKEFTFVKVVYAQPSIGFGRACNLGAYKAIEDGAEYIMILNQDTVLFKNSLEVLLKGINDDNNQNAVYGPIIYDYSKKFIEDKFIQWYLFQSPQMVTDKFDKKKINSSYTVKWLSGACLVLNKKIIKKYGFFEPLIHLYGEDTELCERYSDNGIHFKLLSEFKIGHRHTNRNQNSIGIFLEKKYSTLIRMLLNGKRITPFFYFCKLFLLSFYYRKFHFIGQLYLRMPDLFRYLQRNPNSVQNRIKVFNEKSVPLCK